jgi:hypothetical protein
VLVVGFYAALVVYILFGTVVIWRRTKRRRLARRQTADDARRTVEAAQPESALDSVDATERARQDRRKLVAAMHQCELAAEHRAFAHGLDRRQREVDIVPESVAAKERAWRARRDLRAAMHQRELAAEHRAFALGLDNRDRAVRPTP